MYTNVLHIHNNNIAIYLYQLYTSNSKILWVHFHNWEGKICLFYFGIAQSMGKQYIDSNHRFSVF